VAAGAIVGIGGGVEYGGCLWYQPDANRRLGGGIPNGRRAQPISNGDGFTDGSGGTASHSRAVAYRRADVDAIQHAEPYRYRDGDLNLDLDSDAYHHPQSFTDLDPNGRPTGDCDPDRYGTVARGHDDGDPNHLADPDANPDPDTHAYADVHSHRGGVG
jgi:hypothetical protein